MKNFSFSIELEKSVEGETVNLPIEIMQANDEEGTSELEEIRERAMSMKRSMIDPDTCHRWETYEVKSFGHRSNHFRQATDPSEDDSPSRLTSD